MISIAMGSDSILQFMTLMLLSILIVAAGTAFVFARQSVPPPPVLPFSVAFISATAGFFLAIFLFAAISPSSPEDPLFAPYRLVSLSVGAFAGLIGTLSLLFILRRLGRLPINRF